MKTSANYVERLALSGEGCTNGKAGAKSGKRFWKRHAVGRGPWKSILWPESSGALRWHLSRFFTGCVAFGGLCRLSNTMGYLATVQSNDIDAIQMSVRKSQESMSSLGGAAFHLEDGTCGGLASFGEWKVVLENAH